MGFAFDASGNLHTPTAACTINKLLAAAYSTVAGNGNCFYGGDGGPATSAGLYEPAAVALDSANSMYIADYTEVWEPLWGLDWEDCRIRKVSLGIITTIAGNGICGFAGDAGLATNANINRPVGVAVDSTGTVYIAEGCRVRKVTGGIISTLTGYGGLCAYGLAVDASDNLYVSDSSDCRIRKWDGISTYPHRRYIVRPLQRRRRTRHKREPLRAERDRDRRARELSMSRNAMAVVSARSARGIITTVVTGVCPYGIAVDGQGNLYATGNREVTKVSGGTMTTFAGTGTFGFSGDGGPAVDAQLSDPLGLATDAAGNVYIADTGNHRIRMVAAPPPPSVGGIAEPPVLRPLPAGRVRLRIFERSAAPLAVASLCAAMALLAVYARRRSQ